MLRVNSEQPTARDLEAHRKLHSAGSRLSDIILGGQDGIVNILGLVLGVAAASGSPRIIIAAALSTTFAESLSMAAVSYTSTQAHRDYYRGQVEREKEHIRRFSDIEREEIRRIYELKGFSGKQLEDIVDTITSDVNRWLSLVAIVNQHPIDRIHGRTMIFFIGRYLVTNSYKSKTEGSAYCQDHR